jgi:hypothetical protein
MQEIIIGESDHRFICNDERNIVPIKMDLCSDARKEECPYYIKVKIDTEHISFDQGFCAYSFRKDLSTNKI